MADDGPCRKCGRYVDGDRHDGGLCSVCAEVSAPDDRLDSLVQAASIPNLATLIKRGKDKGLIKPTVGY